MGEQALGSLFCLSQAKSDQMHFMPHSGTSVCRLEACLQTLPHLQLGKKKIKIEV